MLIVTFFLLFCLFNEAKSLRPASLEKPSSKMKHPRSTSTTLKSTRIEECAYDYKGSTGASASGILGFLKRTFVPAGYPASVPPEYARYQILNLLQDLCSYLRGLMATQAVLIGLGVGNKDATALQATVSWIFRDGAGMIGGLVFTSLYSQSFGQNVKSYRLFADLINNVGITLEMVAPLFPRHFLLLVCFASVFKALCGVAAGACGAAINEHWGGVGNNISEVLAKNGAQHSIVSLLGLLLSVRFATFANRTPTRLWSVYCLLTAVHIIANVRAMRVLALRSLNLVRFDIVARRAVASTVVQEAVRGGAVTKDGAALRAAFKSWLATSGDAFTPHSVADAEPVLSLLLPAPLQRIIASLLASGRPSSWTVNFFCSPSLIEPGQLSEALLTDPNPLYLIARDVNARRVNVCLHAGVPVLEQARAYFEAALACSCKEVGLADAKQIAIELFPIFYSFLLAQGWEERRVLLHSKGSTTFKVLRDST